MARRPIRINLPLLEELRQVHREAVSLLPRLFDPGLAAVGLIGLDEDPLHDDWRDPSVTPLNCLVFAATGGNGVHFSLMVRDGMVDGLSPVVVTIPSMVGASFVVGENLSDFLCLGKDRGYFALEQLSYDLELTLEVYTNHAWQPSDPHHEWVGYTTDDYKAHVLSILKSRLGLSDWGQPEKFHRLQSGYQPLLQYPRSHWGSA
jgi:hypothetical protein